MESLWEFMTREGKDSAFKSFLIFHVIRLGKWHPFLINWADFLSKRDTLLKYLVSCKDFCQKNLDRRWWPNAFSPSTYNIWGIHESMCALQGELWVQLQFHSYDESVVKRRFLFNKSMLILIKLCILLHTAVIISKNFLSM